MTNVRRLPRPTTPATLRALARMSHELAVGCRLRGDDAGYSAHWRDVMRFDELATEARIREERIAVQIEERRQLSEGAGDLVRRIRGQIDLEEAPGLVRRMRQQLALEEARAMRAADQGPKL